jgi:hypothetical protein
MLSQHKFKVASFKFDLSLITIALIEVDFRQHEKALRNILKHQKQEHI